jgi:hypothetical protein
MVKYKWNLGMGCFCGLGKKGGIFTQVYLLINNSEKIVSQRLATAGKTCLRKAGRAQRD